MPARSFSAPEAAVQSPQFRVGVELVPLTVTATERLDRYVTNLREDEFRVTEDGHPQVIQSFDRGRSSIIATIILNVSAGMRERLSAVQDAAVGFIRKLGPNDVASVVDVATTWRLRQDFTSNHTALERAIRQTTPTGGPALFDALFAAFKTLNDRIHASMSAGTRRAVIVLVTDGEDQSSRTPFADVLDMGIRSNATVYAVGVLATRPLAGLKQDPHSVVARFAADTGGRLLLPADSTELAAVHREITDELDSQYFLVYASTNPRNVKVFHQVSVQITRPGVTARIRPGYYELER